MPCIANTSCSRGLPRKSYSIDYKLKVLAYCDLHGRQSTMQQFHIDSSMICRWLQSRDKLLSTASGNNKYRTGNPGRLVTHSSIETELYQWIINKRSAGISIPLCTVQQQMLLLTHRIDPHFKASTGWLYGFMRRFNLSLRTPNTAPQLLSATDISLRIQSFKQFYTQLYANHSIDNVINVDQTPVWWNAINDTRTVSIRGQRKVTVTRSPNANPREKVSVILACHRDGRKLPPAIIMKSNRTTLQRARIKLINGVLVFMNPRTSMANSDIMQRWIRLMMPQTTHKNLLILDSFRGHLTDDIKQACIDTNTVRAVIPGGLTSHLQPLDLTVNRSFKAHLRKTYNRMLTARQRQTPTERLHILANAVRYSWNQVDNAVIKNGFRSMIRRMRHN
jgi:hypothetical protein